MTEETADQRMRRMAKEYGIPYTPPATAAPVQTQQPAPTAKKPSGGDGIMGLLGGRKQQIDEQERKAVKGYAQGGKIKGPGTPTSDSIGGVVKETGEPIKVSTEERIVSSDQEKALMRIAEMLGFESVDAMFESMTGKPVGPTINGGMMAAATGMSPEDDPVKRGIETMKSQLAPQQPAPTAQQVYAGVLKPSPLASNYVGTGPTDPDVNGRNAIAQPSGTVQRGIDTMKSQLNQNPAPMFADNAKASAAGEAHLQSLYPAGTFDKPADVTASPPAAAKPAMGAEEAGIRAKNAAVMNGVQSAADPAALAALKAKSAAGILGGAVRTTTMPAGSKAPIGSGYDAADKLLGGRDISGQKLITNVADGQKVVDDSASALRDQQSNNPYWSPAAQLERMQRRRLMSETGSGVTDPNVQAAAQKSLGILGNPADNQLKQVQAQGITAQNESNAMLADLQKKAIGGDQQALATLNAMRGKGDANLRDNFMAVGGGQEFDATAGVMRNVPQRLIDLRTGKEVGGAAQTQAQGPSFASKAELQAAIKAGKVKPGQTVMTPNGPMVVK